MSFKIEEKISELRDCVLNRFRPDYSYVPSLWNIISIILFIYLLFFIIGYLSILFARVPCGLYKCFLKKTCVLRTPRDELRISEHLLKTCKKN